MSGRAGQLPEVVQLTFQDGTTTNACGGIAGNGGPYLYSYPGHVLGSVVVMGVSNFYSSANCVVLGFRLGDSFTRPTYPSLQAHGYPGNLQGDWHWCSRCGGLYYGTGIPNDGVNRCPAGGQHASLVTGNYVLPVLDPHSADAIPAGMQGGWRWCSQCNLLAYHSTMTICMANPRGHDPPGSGNYFLGVGPAPGDATIAPEQGWRYCEACGALHYAGSTMVCPVTNGAHRSIGSGEYWLSTISA